MDWLSAVKMRVEPHADKAKAEGMKKYMKNHFEFLGIPKPKREILTKDFILQTSKLEFGEVQNLIELLWKEECREYQYIAIEILIRSKCWKSEASILLFEKTIVTKSWWDTVDLIASKAVGGYFTLFPLAKETYIDKWMNSNNLWLQRTCIIFQLHYKTNTDQELLFALCDYFSKDKEFFIKKAIGWSLRQLARTNPQAVIQFVHTHQLQPLSIKEATKHLI